MVGWCGLEQTEPAPPSAFPRPITIPKVMTLKTLADVRKLIAHIPKERDPKPEGIGEPSRMQLRREMTPSC